MNNQWGTNCWDFIDKAEGNVLKAYWDGNGWAIGRGIHAPDVNQDTIWTAEQSDQRFTMKLNEIQADLNPHIQAVLPQLCFDAVMSIRYNIGAAIDDSTLIRKINLGDNQGAADEFSKWCHKSVGGQMVEDAGLKARREKERAMFLLGAGLSDVPAPAPQAPVVAPPVPVQAVPVGVGGNVNPIKKFQSSKNLTKVLSSIVALLVAALQDPNARQMIAGVVSQHPQLTTIVLGIGSLAALLHDPNPKPS
jgi:lysozyme